MKQVYLLMILISGAPILNASGQSDHQQQVVINEVLSSNTKSNYDMDFGAFSDWIELYNPTANEVDLGGWYLSDDRGNPDKWRLPENCVMAGGDYLLFWADDKNLVPGQKTFVEFTEITEITVSEYHLDFKINSDKEEILLFNADLELIDSVLLSNQARDYSFGRTPGNPGEWRYLGEPTPLRENSAMASDTFDPSGKPYFSIEGGVYRGSQTVELGSSTPGAVIKFTTDGSDPVSNSPEYSEPLEVHFTQVIKARLYEPGKLPGETVSESFIIDKETDLPILSLSTDHENLFGFDFGIYQMELKNREVTAHLEYFNESGSKEFDIDAGIQLFGSQIFKFDQKPFSIFFRNRYGKETLDYKLFQDKDIDSFRSLVLRNGGNDNNLTMFRDGLGALLAANQFDIDYQAYKPVVVYINGEYWGIYNLREKLNNDYLHANHGVNPDHIDLLEDSLLVNNGDANAFSRLMEFADKNDLSQENNYRYLSERVDMDEFTNYMIYKLYGGYKQWQVNNKYWRERVSASTWRWIAFDMEHCFGGPGSGTYDEDVLELILGTGSGGAEWSIRLFRKLMNNTDFRNTFIQRTALLLSSTLQTERVILVIDSIRSYIEPEMELHIARWNSPVSMGAWIQFVNYLKEFAGKRNDYMYQHLKNQFNLGDTSLVTIKAGKGGSVLVCSSHLVKSDSTSFTLFNGVPLELYALPDPGYAFTGWSNTGQDRKIQLVPESDTSITALFEKRNTYVLPDTISGTLVIRDNDQPWISAGNLVIPSDDTLLIEKGVTLQMHPNASILNFGSLIIEGTGKEPVTITVNPDITESYYSPGSVTWGGICVESTDSTSICHTILHNASFGPEEDKYKAAISVFNGNVLLRGIHISGVHNPVYCYMSKVQIDSCTLSSDGTGDLINLRACSNPVIRSNDLRGNFYKDTDAIDLDSVSGGIVENNLIYSFFGSNSDGIDLGESSLNITIKGNSIFSCSDKGVSVGQGSKTELTQNLIVDCNQGVGIKDFNSFAYINQNTLYNNHTGIASFEKNQGNGGGSVQIENTIIANSIVQAVLVDELSSLTVGHSLSNTDTLLGYNNLHASPGFAGASNNNFSLEPGSPCKDAGTPGQQDPDGTRADIGAFFHGNNSINPTVVISEINFNSHPSFNPGDWVELYNPGSETADLSNWVLKGVNGQDEFFFPDSIYLPPGSFMVIAGNKEAVHELYDHEMNIIGDFSFGLNRSGETIKLYNKAYQLVHSLQYGSNHPWPDGPDAKGASLEWYCTDHDNSTHRNWHASYVPGGTPGKENSETQPVAGLYINEFMAKNRSAWPDEMGEYDDWIEIFNGNGFPIDLAGLNFTYGTPDTRLKMIPYFDEQATSIEANGFVLFWADKDPEQGTLHADFNLRASGGTIGLAQVIEKDIIYIDKIEYSDQQEDISYGRYPDGSAFLTSLELTPGSSNRLTTIGEITGNDHLYRIYPNPADEFLYIESTGPEVNTFIELRSITGQIMREIILGPGERKRLDVSLVPPGIYFLLFSTEESARKIIIF